VDTVEFFGDAARGARECTVMSQAVTLARWIGSGRRPVTPGQVLRKADVPAAGTALRVDVPARLRTMADIWELHRPWCAAVATGLLQVSDGSVTAGPALESWPPRNHGQVYPVCVEFRGDSPVEYWSEEEPEEPEPFGLNEVNRRLAALGREPA
jgi:hypothetical protein